LSISKSPTDRSEWTELVSSKRQYSQELRDLSEKIIEVDNTSRDLSNDIRTERTNLKENIRKINLSKEKISVLNSELSKVSEDLSKSKSFLTIMESRLPKEDEQTLMTKLLELRSKIDKNPTESQYMKNEMLERYKMISMSLEALKAVKMMKDQVLRLKLDSKNLNDRIVRAEQEVSNLQSMINEQIISVDKMVASKALLHEKRQFIMSQYNQSVDLLEKVNTRLDSLAFERKAFSESRSNQSSSDKYKNLLRDFREKAQEKFKAGEKLTLDELRMAFEDG
jgi:uncharacterized coiled-coil DUF342 family protein